MEIVKTENKQGKPRSRFCWECGRKLRGNHYAEVTFSDGTTRILHKRCAVALEKGEEGYGMD